MKRLTGIVLLAFVAWAVMLTSGFSAGESELETRLEGLNAREALVIANQWHWERRPVTTYVTSKEVVFEFKTGTIKRIALPKDEMMVAVAPYVRKTHK